MSEHIHSAVEGRIGHVVLDRPSALNSLDLGMCVGVHDALTAWSGDDSVEAVVVTSSGKHFCAGGDIKAIRESALAGDYETCRTYFVTEYAMNQAIADYAKPYVAVLHGATMGGGLGVSMHGSHRVVDETLMTAMPETAIAFVPDVGASWTLPRLCGGGERGLAVALYLGLTGARMGADDALYTGLATHRVASADREALVEALRTTPLDEALAAHCGSGTGDAAAASSAIAANLARIEEVFSAESVQEMVTRLEDGPQDEFASEALKALRAMSPTSMVATVELFRRGAEAPDLATCLAYELGLGEWIVRHPDFVEGVRAVLVDKTRDASWSPSTLDDVDVAGIRSALG